METAEFDVNDFTKEFAGDERLLVRFFNKPAEIHEKSVEAGRPIFETFEFIHIMVPGDRDNQIVRPVRPGDKFRFRKQYEMFKAEGSGESVNGTPLESWNQLSLAQIEEFRYFGVRTVEALSTLRDDVVLKMPGAMELKRKAERFLIAATAEAPMKKMEEELAQRDNEIATLQSSMNQLIAEMRELRNEREGRKNAKAG